ncbi:MAG: D-alanine--D-alanine ligase [Eubacteriaceae bacterium]|nr:D-alanine--D-alanine ligase [Eubacteriaceae bacterium]
MDKKKVCVFFGGKSGEHEVSLRSSSNVINAIDTNKYEIHMIGITHDGEIGVFDGPVSMLPDGSWNNPSNFTKGHVVYETIAESDVMFPVIHGTFGEDGTLQGYFEILGKPYVGCGVLASALAMDKDLSKKLLDYESIPTAKALVFTKRDIDAGEKTLADKAISAFGLPVFVKPANLGSSVGVSKAHTKDELAEALVEAARYDEKVLVEEYIDGSELEVAILGNSDPAASSVGMIIPCNEFYDYEAKYESGDDSEIIIPAPIDGQIAESIKTYAIKAYKTLGCSGLARIDFFLAKDGRVILNELNTMPGFTNISMYSKLWNDSGVGYGELVDSLIGLALERDKERKGLLFKKQ